MAAGKTATLSFRIEFCPKGALRAAAKPGHRRVANMVEVTIREYCRRAGVAIVEMNPKTSQSKRKSR